MSAPSVRQDNVIFVPLLICKEIPDLYVTLFILNVTGITVA